MICNLNDLVKFKLTEHGKSILDHYILDMYEKLQHKVSLVDLADSDVKRRTDGYLEAQLYKFMEIFGGAHLWASSSAVVDRNQIEILSVCDIMGGKAK